MASYSGLRTMLLGAFAAPYVLGALLDEACLAHVIHAARHMRLRRLNRIGGHFGRQRADFLGLGRKCIDLLLPNRLSAAPRSRRGSRPRPSSWPGRNQNNCTSFSKASSVPGSKHMATLGSPTEAKPRVIVWGNCRYQLVADPRGPRRPGDFSTLALSCCANAPIMLVPSPV